MNTTGAISAGRKASRSPNENWPAEHTRRDEVQRWGRRASISTAEIRLIRGMLYGVTLQGAGEVALAALAMLIVTIFAAGFPAYRAASIDPMRELRSR
jgi:ABC-type transport system involved in cytochrome bd biosynthesis fused ATPase/permease subunit